MKYKIITELKLMQDFKVDELFDTDLEFKNDEHIFGFYGNCLVTDINL